MSIKESIYKRPRIQKFKGKFKEIKGGGTILFTNTIQSIRDPNCLAVYVYLASKPPEWDINVKEITKHFIKMGRDKVRKTLNDLCLIGLLDRLESRDLEGRFKEYSYYLNLQPAPENQGADKPLPENPAPANPAPANQGAYKEENGIEKIESKKGLIKIPNILDQQQYAFYLKEGKEIPKQYRYVELWLNHANITK